MARGNGAALPSPGDRATSAISVDLESQSPGRDVKACRYAPPLSSAMADNEKRKQASNVPVETTQRSTAGYADAQFAVSRSAPPATRNLASRRLKPTCRRRQKRAVMAAVAASLRNAILANSLAIRFDPSFARRSRSTNAGRRHAEPRLSQGCIGRAGPRRLYRVPVAAFRRRTECGSAVRLSTGVISSDMYRLIFFS